MKRLYALGIAILTLVALAGCNDTKEFAESLERTIVLTATHEGVSPDTKTLRMDDCSTWWNPKEEISVFYGSGSNGGSKFTSKNTTIAETTEFEGSISMSESKEFWAVHPYSIDNSCDGSSIITVIPSQQTGVEGNFSDDAFPAMGKSSSLSMPFYNICGGIKFFVSRTDIKSVMFKGNNGETLAGKVKVAFGADGKPEVAEIIDGKTEVKLTAPDGGTFKAGKYYYITLLPTVLDAGITMTFSTVSDIGILTSDKAQTIKRSIFGVLKNVDSRVSNWEQHQLPTIADFAKEFAKVADKWDNNIGTVSYTRAKTDYKYINANFVPDDYVITLNGTNYYKYQMHEMAMRALKAIESGGSFTDEIAEPGSYGPAHEPYHEYDDPLHETEAGLDLLTNFATRCLNYLANHGEWPNACGYPRPTDPVLTTHNGYVCVERNMLMLARFFRKIVINGYTERDLYRIKVSTDLFGLCIPTAAVDLGLPSGLKWAACNVGASKPEEYGEYFAWGETEPKTDYSWSTYNWCNGNNNNLTKYCTLSWYWDSSAPMDNKTVLDLEDDAAHENWGDSWRMPTYAEWTELRENCTWEWTDNYNGSGMAGRIAKSKKIGFTDKFIFLPAAGSRCGTKLNDLGSGGSYWTSSLGSDGPIYAWSIGFFADSDGGNGYRYFGRSVRPVSE